MFNSISPTTAPTRRIVIIVAAAVLVVGGGIYALTSGPDPEESPSVMTTNTGESTNGATATNADPAVAEAEVPTCPYSITQSPELAMSYGVPDGWVVEIANGTLAIMEDESNLVTAFVYTAKLIQDLSATAFLNSFGDVFRATIEGAGGVFALGEITATDTVASAPATATVAEGDLAGTFMTEKEPGFITFTAYWAPTDQLAAKEATLQSVLNCYTRTTALTDADLAAATVAAQSQTTGQTSSAPWGALAQSSDTNFSFSIPNGWTSNVSSSGESTGLALDAPASDASVAFLYNVGRYGVVDTEEFARSTMLITYGIDATLSNKQTVEGADIYDFNGMFNGKAVRGAATVRIDAYQTFFAQYLGVQIANADLWEAYAPTLNAIQSSIRLTDAGQQLSSLPAQPNYNTEALFGDSVTSSQKYKEEVEDRSAENWSDAMRGYQTMESPSTGDTYDVPLNSYNPTGPNGGGYYRQLPGGGLEELSPVS